MPSSPTLSLRLTPELRRLVDDVMASGRHRSVEEAVEAALRGLAEPPGGTPQAAARPDEALPAGVPQAAGRPVEALAAGVPEEAGRQIAALFEQAGVGMAQVDLTGRFLRVNDRYCAILSRSREELLRLRMQDVTHVDDLPGNRDLFARLVGLGEPFEIEKRYLRPDGSIVWVRNAVTPIRDGEDGFTTALGVCADVTARKTAEAALRESEALKSAILDAALDCIVAIDGSGRIVEWNPAAERTFGHPAAAVLGEDLARLIIPADLRDGHLRGMARYLETGRSAVLGRRVELEALRADGSRFPIELAITATDLEGKRYFTAHLRDIGLRRRAEAALRESEQRLRSTYEHAFVGIAEVDSAGRFLRVNEAFCEITGFDRDELLARTFTDVTHPEDQEPDLGQFLSQMAGEIDVYTVEKRYLHKNGHPVWIELAASRVDDDGGRPLYGVRVVRDITERKRWEEHQRLLINELNHRVKNTLATVQSIAGQTLRTASTAKEANEAIEGRLLALSRAHDVLTRENWEAAELQDLVREAMAPFRVEGEGRIQVEGPDLRLPPRMALAVAMALQELATNAVKYGALSTPAGGIRIGWTLLDGDPPRLRLTWREAGGPPVQAPSRRGFGTRLIERSLAGQLGGAVRIDFAPEGLTCTVEAPVPSSHEEPTAG